MKFHGKQKFSNRKPSCGKFKICEERKSSYHISINYILLQYNKFHLVKDIKVIPGEECITQQHLLICDLKLKISKNTEKKFVPRLRTWKLKDPSIKEAYVESLNNLLVNYRIDNPDNIDDIWKYFTESVVSATEKGCDWSKKGKWRQ